MTVDVEILMGSDISYTIRISVGCHVSRPPGVMATRLTTNQEIAGSTPAVVNLSFAGNESDYVLLVLCLRCSGTCGMMLSYTGRPSSRKLSADQPCVRRHAGFIVSVKFVINSQDLLLSAHALPVWDNVRIDGVVPNYKSMSACASQS